MQFAVQASVQGRAMPGPSTFHVRHHVGAPVARAVSCSTLSSLGSLAPRLDALQLPLKPSLNHHRNCWSVRAEAGAGAYDRDAFVESNEAAKIAHVRVSIAREISIVCVVSFD